MTNWTLWACAAGMWGLMACEPDPSKAGASALAGREHSVNKKLAQHTPVSLTSDLATLTENERQMIPLLIDAARHMDAIYWRQAYGNRDSLLQSLSGEDIRRYAGINYAPWDRLDDNAPFVEGVGSKPTGAGFYPRDMSKAEFEKAASGSAALGQGIPVDIVFEQGTEVLK